MSEKPINTGKKTKPSLDKRKIKEMFEAKNTLAIPKDVIEDIEKKGCEYRLVDANKFKENGSEWGWQVYKLPSDIPRDEWRFGGSVDGTMRRGSLVLVVRPKEYGEAHREILQDRNKRYAKSDNASKAALKRGAVGIKSKVYEGYENN